MSPMSKQVFEIEDEAPQGAPGSLDFSKVLRYAGLVMKVINALEGVGTLQVGDGQDLDVVEVRVKGKTYEWDMGTLTRTK